MIYSPHQAMLESRGKVTEVNERGKNQVGLGQIGGFVALAVVLLSFHTLACAAVSTAERDTLIALYDSTDGPNWVDNTNWPVGDPCTNSWFGITCNESGTSVTEVSLYVNGLVGSLPSALDDLTNLTRLELLHNQLSGGIPPELGNLSSFCWPWL